MNSDIVMQAAYRKAAGFSVPCPMDADTPDVDWWWDHVAKQAPAWGEAGITAVLLPPVAKTQSGCQPTGDGYGVTDPYDIGSKDQCGSIPTRFGTREQLQRCIAVLAANGIVVYADVVNHQRAGGKDGVYRYPSATGTTNGRFPLDPPCFVGPPPRVPRDDVAGGPATDYAFGDELAPDHALPKGYVKNGLIANGRWLRDTLGISGWRIDDVKGEAVDFCKAWIEAVSKPGAYFFGEFYDGSPQNLDWWTWASGMDGICAVEDFDMHFKCVGFGNNGSHWNMAQLQWNGGYFQWSPEHALTFVENVDSDVEGYASVVWSKVLCYAWMLTSEGYPCVFFKDYATDENCYGLKPWVDNLMWIRQRLASGSTIVRWADEQTYVYERTGGAGLLVALNNDLWNGWETRRVQTGFGPNAHLHDYSGHAGDLWTDSDGYATIGIPENDNGQGFVCYSLYGLGGPLTPIARPVTHVFFGAGQNATGFGALDIPPATNGITTVGRIWCAKGSDVELMLSTRALVEEESIAMNLLGPTGEIVSTEKLENSGWHSIILNSQGLPAEGIPFTVTATYQAPQTLDLETA